MIFLTKSKDICVFVEMYSSENPKLLSLLITSLIGSATSIINLSGS